MTDYLYSSNVKCSGCGVLVNTADPSCDCQTQKDEYHDCPECGIKLDAELFPTLRACYDHEEDRETLREIAADLDEYANLQIKSAKVMLAKIAELEAELRRKP